LRAPPAGVRLCLQVVAVLALVLPVPCATLERLTLDEMIAKSTAIVRGTVTGSWAAFSGPIIYTHYTIRVTEQYKGGTANSVEVVIPGGTVDGFRQFFSGAPVLERGAEYVLMLWTGKSGLTQVMGLTQGLFAIQPGGSDPVVTRAATRELMLDRQTGQAVKDETLTMHLSALRSRIASGLTLGRGSSAK